MSEVENTEQVNSESPEPKEDKVLQALIERVKKHRLAIEAIPADSVETCGFGTCTSKPVVIMEGFYLCAKHAERLLVNIIPPELLDKYEEFGTQNYINII